MKNKGSIKIDIYIIKNFLGTFVFAITLLMFITVVFDLTEKLDDFIEKKVPLNIILFDYYLNFIPYFAVLFSPLFTFITVIFFTSKFANNSEIIAMFCSGLSFRRMLVPYFFSALIIAIFTFTFGNFIIPKANKIRYDFEEAYVRSSRAAVYKRNIHIQVHPNVYIYMESFSSTGNIGYKFSMEKFSEKGELESKLIADYVKWDTAKKKWQVRNYFIRNIQNGTETIEEGRSIDTTLNIQPEDFNRWETFVETMNMGELKQFINQQRLQGLENITPFLIERYRRVALPFSTFILTLIGVTLSSRKVKGGTGAHIGAGIGLSFAYILFMQFSTQFAVSGSINPLFAVWLPNIIFGFIAVVLYYYTPK